jgi:hypothetical protein
MEKRRRAKQSSRRGGGFHSLAVSLATHHSHTRRSFGAAASVGRGEPYSGTAGDDEWNCPKWENSEREKLVNLISFRWPRSSCLPM